MLNGIDPVLIFQFKKLQEVATQAPVLSSIPVVSAAQPLFNLAPIPVYLSPDITGLVIDSEDKSVSISTDVQTKIDGDEPDVKQKGVESKVDITLTGNRDSIGIALLSAFIDQVFDKCTSQEYSLSYLHGPTTIFNAVLMSYSVNTESDTDKVTIRVELSRGSTNPQKAAPLPQVSGSSGALPGASI